MLMVTANTNEESKTVVKPKTNIAAKNCKILIEIQ